MKKSASTCLEKYKVKIFIGKLKPITNWSKVKEGVFIFNKNAETIRDYKCFIRYEEKANIIQYENEDELFYDNAEDWYYYNECSADIVDKSWTPKLFLVISKKNTSHHLMVACNLAQLVENFNKKYNCKYSENTFIDNFTFEEVNKVDEFNIILN